MAWSHSMFSPTDTHIYTNAIYRQELTWRPIFGHVSVELHVVFVVLCVGREKREEPENQKSEKKLRN